METLPIILKSPGFVIVDKPSGLLSVPGKGEANQDCVAARVRILYPAATGPLIVHRLDMDTSGLLVMALDAESQRRLSGQFERREVSKRYVAVLEGSPDGDSGIIDLPIRLDVDRRPYQIVDFLRGRAALTRWRATARDICNGEPRTRVEFEPVTGRSHQLRLHAAAPRDIDGRPGGLGCPIVGDPLYGRGKASGPRLLLHANWLSFRDPLTGEPVIVESPPPF